MNSRIKKILQRNSLAVFLAIILVASTLSPNLLHLHKVAYAADNQLEEANSYDIDNYEGEVSANDVGNTTEEEGFNNAEVLIDETIYDIRYEVKDILEWLKESDIGSPVPLELWLELLPFQDEKSYDEFRSRFESSELYIIKANLIEDNSQSIEGCNSYVLYEVDAAGNENIIFFVINQMEITKQFQIIIPGLDTSNLEIYCYQELSLNVPKESDTSVVSGGAITVIIELEREPETETASGSAIDVEVDQGDNEVNPEDNVEADQGDDVESDQENAEAEVEAEVETLEEVTDIENELEYTLEINVTQGESYVGENGVAFASVTLALIESLALDSIVYLNANLFDYDKTTLNNAIGLTDSKGYSTDKFYVGPVGGGTQNTWTGSGKGVVQGLVNETLIDNENIMRISTNSINLFPRATDTAKGITAYLNYGFPLKEIGNGYYEFDSEKYHVYIKNKVSGTNNLILQEGGRWVLSGSQEVTSFFPFNATNNSAANYLFSMELSGEFYYPKDGKVNGEDLVFEFSGDDDVWLYLKDNSNLNNNYKLALDLGGIHDKNSGRINFATGLITVDKVASVYSSNWSDKNNQTVYWYLYDSATFAQMKENGKIASNVTIESGKYLGFTRENYKQYSFKLYYMERGEWASNCYIKLNFPLIDTSKVNVVKEVENLQEENKDRLYEFKLFISQNQNDFTNEYLEDPANVSDVIYLKAGEFGGFDVPDGYYYVIQETKTSSDIFTTRWSSINSSGQIQEAVSGTRTATLSQTDTNLVRFINTFPSAGTLTIKKSVTVDYEREFLKPSQSDYSFIVEITDISENEGDNIKHGLEGAVNNTATIHNQTLSILFKLINNQTYVIENIPEGCTYKVIEITDMELIDFYYDHNVQVTVDDAAVVASPIVVEDYGEFINKQGVYVSGSGFGSVKEIEIEEGYTVTYQPNVTKTYTYTHNNIEYPFTNPQLIENNKYRHMNLDFVSIYEPVQRNSTSNQWGVWVGRYNQHYDNVTIVENKEGLYFCRSTTTYSDSKCKHDWYEDWEFIAFTFLEAYHYDNLNLSETIQYEYKGAQYKNVTELEAAIRASEGDLMKGITVSVDGTITVTYKAGKILIYMPSSIDIEFTNDFQLLLGKIKVTKSLVDTQGLPQFDNEDNTFIFTLKNVDPHSPGYGLEYQREINIKVGDITGDSIFIDLPMGTYEIKELDHMRYHLTTDHTALKTVLLSKESDDLTIEGIPNRSVSYENTKDKEEYFSDTNVGVNTVYKDNETTTFRKYIYKDGIKLEYRFDFDTKEWILITDEAYINEVAYIKEEEYEF